MRRVAVVLLLFFAVARRRSRGRRRRSSPVYDAKGRIIETPLAPPEQPKRLTPGKRGRRSSSPIRRSRTGCRATRRAAARPTPTSTADTRSWQVNVWWDKAGEIATGRVDDATRKVTEAWTGPQVAWGMARGSPGAFGGKKINSYPVWLALLRALPARARRLAPAVLAAHARPRRAALVLGVAVVLQPRQHLRERAARVSAARVPDRPRPLDRASRDARLARPHGVAGVAPARARPRSAPAFARRSSTSATRT